MFNQRIGRALHRTRDAGRAQQAAHERRLAGAEVALQRHDHAATATQARAAAPHACGCSRVGKMNVSGDTRRRRAAGSGARLGRARGANPAWGHELGFESVGVADVDLGAEERACWTGSRRPARRDGLYGAARRRPRASRRARARHGARDHRAHELLAGAAEPPPARSPIAARVRLALRARPRLSQGAAARPCAARRRIAGRRRPVRLPRVHRQRAGARGGARRAKRDSAGAASTRCC